MADAVLNLDYSPSLGRTVTVSKLRGSGFRLGTHSAKIDDYREDVRLITSGQLADVVMASAGFTLPEGLDKSDSPVLFVAGTQEAPAVRRWAAALAQQIPNGVDRVAIGMLHDWPLRHPDLFARTVDGQVYTSKVTVINDPRPRESGSGHSS